MERGEFFEGFAGDFGGVQAEAVGAGGVEAGEEGRVFGAEEVRMRVRKDG